ncbi:transcriptional regulator, PadR family [Austwickia chelonae]|uniref:Putative PadR family transcriptional regulator n=1 Tax=Austwickia chelonae NBRC 105200 TaxID=1184607 RepID=K6V8J3_9MICO|nr:PadR family transcriptional regulator [Austwickia chelonae]GAB78513.1 putative PadR family transcriptional regulator [Austwickia chelonae NBRC 105200]SEW40284.1 transcriptional regulator, PadR family [Austwickia chelonae]
MNDDTTRNTYPPTWVRATLELVILGLVADEPRHGYAITTRLEEAGFGTLRGGSIYPVLARLEDAGHITADWIEPRTGPGRKNYTITELGRTRLTRDTHTWRHFAADILHLTQPHQPPDTHPHHR